MAAEAYLPLLASIAEGAISGAAYGLVVYVRRREDGDEFVPRKLAATVLVGGVVGGLLGSSGLRVTVESVEARLAMYAGAVHAAEGALKWANRRWGPFW